MKDLEVVENEDGSISIVWDDDDPRYDFLNNLTEEQVVKLLGDFVAGQ
jgi:hypothetical protein